jgi:hypothetical protein
MSLETPEGEPSLTMLAPRPKLAILEEEMSLLLAPEVTQRPDSSSGRAIG